MTQRKRTAFGCPPAADPIPVPPAGGCRPAPGNGQTTRFGAVPDPVAWYEGMLLAPQHFQQAQLQADSLLAYHLAALSPFHWGVRRLVLDCAALQAGTLTVQELEAVLPDGLVARHDASTAPALQVALEPYASTAKQGVLTVHLAVRSRAARPLASGDLARYTCYTGEPAADEITGAGSVEIPRLRAKLTLIVSAQRPRGWVSLPLARVRRADHGWALTQALPPLLSLPPALPLGERCAQLASMVRVRATGMGRALRRARAAGLWARAAAAQAGLAALSAALPRLEALVHTGAAHPFTLYLALCDLAGHLAAAGPGRPAPLFPAYDHDDPRGSLTPVLEFCERAAEEVQDAFILVPFQRHRGSFRLAARAAWKDQAELVVGAVAPACATPKELNDWVARARIASASRIPALAAGDGVGAPRQVVPTPPGLSGGDGRIYFRVAVDRAFVIPGERLQVLPPVACAPAAGPRRLALCLPLASAASADTSTSTTTSTTPTSTTTPMTTGTTMEVAG
ncbi:MAG TPA: type VI secretion system baseplate subunit TssK [Longimicrobium sp.]|nr:type VI secretion system baseplate subunit TssK [Longimicrobium sp.]